jgi:hypothetical protein
MRFSSPFRALPSMPVLGVAIAAGVIEWVALWRSRHRRHAASPRS